jgi:hypothetical protein
MIPSAIRVLHKRAAPQHTGVHHPIDCDPAQGGPAAIRTSLYVAIIHSRTYTQTTRYISLQQRAFILRAVTRVMACSLPACMSVLPSTPYHPTPQLAARTLAPPRRRAQASSQASVPRSTTPGLLTFPSMPLTSNYHHCASMQARSVRSRPFKCSAPASCPPQRRACS